MLCFEELYGGERRVILAKEILGDRKPTIRAHRSVFYKKNLRQTAKTPNPMTIVYLFFRIGLWSKTYWAGCLWRQIQKQPRNLSGQGGAVTERDKMTGNMEGLLVVVLIIKFVFCQM